MNESTEITKCLEELKIGIHELVKGKLSPFIISPKILKHTISQIQTILNEKFRGFYLVHTSPSHFYSFANILYSRQHSSLFISVKFPISTFSNPLSMFKVLSYPVPINSTSPHATQVLDLPTYFVVTSDNQHFNTFSHEKLQSCRGSTIFYCSESMPLVSSVSPDCVAALFFNAKEKIHNLCNFRFLINVIKPSIQPISDTALLIYKTNTIVFDCQHGHKIVKGCNFCLINLPCMCSVSTDSLFLPKKIEQCQNHSDSITTLHPVNLALIQQFFSTETYNSLMGDTTFTEPVTMNIPNFRIYNHSFSKFIAQDQDLHLSLKRIAQATKKDQVVFKSLSEPLLDGQISVNDSWPDLKALSQ